MANMKPFAIKVTVRDPEDAQNFLEALILAQQNKESHIISQLIDGVNQGMSAYNKERIAEQEAVAG
jgi:hypothetical protein